MPCYASAMQPVTARNANSFTARIRPCLRHPQIRDFRMKAQSVEAVIFDMDGVLTNTMGVSIKAAQKMYKKLYDVDVSEEVLNEAAGTAEDNFISAPADKVGATGFDLETARPTYFEELEALVESHSDEMAFTGGSDLVKSLLERNIKIAVASSAPLTKVKTSLKAAGINIDDFGAVCCEDTFKGPLKPEPDVFLKAADDLGVKPDNAVVIEDADVGVQAAKAGGFRVVALLTSKDRQTMENESPNAIFDDISKLDADTLLSLEAKREASAAQVE
eukprot:jgi/Ulvmu1/4082/UM019_0060.1